MSCRACCELANNQTHQASVGEKVTVERPKKRQLLDVMDRTSQQKRMIRDIWSGKRKQKEDNLEES